jgi:metal-dependent amidase/aminoacylase/carboxypeptidase family protein
VPALPPRIVPFDRSALITIIHATLGEIAFGTTPGYAELRATLRTHFDKDLDKLCKYVRSYIRKIGNAHGIEAETELTEYFPATHNHSKNTRLISEAFKKAGLKTTRRTSAMSCSHDFGNYLQSIPGAIFGLGSVKKLPRLHNPDYDFPDSILPEGITAFASIMEAVHRNHHS